MQVLDYHRSYFMFEIDFEAFPPKTVTDHRQNLHNRARIRIDCRCTITSEDGSRTDFYLGESCKTERVGADRSLGIFTQPNGDFRPVMSEEETLILKSWERNDRRRHADPSEPRTAAGAPRDRHARGLPRAQVHAQARGGYRAADPL